MPKNGNTAMRSNSSFAVGLVSSKTVRFRLIFDREPIGSTILISLSRKIACDMQRYPD